MRTFNKIIIGLLIVFGVWNVYVLMSHKDQTELAMSGFIENSTSAEGYLVKSETVVTSKSAGMIKSYYEEGEKVPKNGKVVSVISSVIDEEAQNELATINQRISEIKSSDMFSGDVLSLDEQIKKTNTQIISLMAERKMSKITSLKKDLLVLIDKKAAVEGESSQELLKTLTAKKTEIEKKIGGSGVDMYAPCSGIYSSVIDGLETVLSPLGIDKLTVKNLEELKGITTTPKERINPGDAAFKIIDNFSWYIAVVMDESDIGDMKKDDMVFLRARESAMTEFSALVYNVSEADNGKRVVVFAPKVEVEGLLEKRHVAVDVIKSRYEGLKIPITALCVEDGVTGVYVESSSDAVFKKVEVLCKTDKYMIVKENNQSEDTLLLYDSVIVNGKERK